MTIASAPSGIERQKSQLTSHARKNAAGLKAAPTAATMSAAVPTASARRSRRTRAASVTTVALR